MLSDIKAELRLRVFEKRALREMFGNNRDGIIECWEKLLNEYIHSLCSSIRIRKTRMMRSAWHVARMGVNGNSYMVLVENAGRKRPLEKLRHRRKGNIKICVR